MGAPVLAVGAVIFDPRGRVLVVRRGREPSKGAWTLPGGKVEPGETPERAIVREVREETGLEVRVVAPLEVYALRRDGWSFDIHEHLCAPTDDRAPAAGDDADEVRWVDVDELDALGVHADAIAVVRRARR